MVERCLGDVDPERSGCLEPTPLENSMSVSHLRSGSGHRLAMTSLLANDPINAPTLWDVAGLAQRLGVTERFVRRLVAERRVPFLKIGKFIRFDPRAVDAWLEAAKVSQV